MAFSAADYSVAVCTYVSLPPWNTDSPDTTFHTLFASEDKSQFGRDTRLPDLKKTALWTYGPRGLRSSLRDK